MKPRNLFAIVISAGTLVGCKESTTPASLNNQPLFAVSFSATSMIGTPGGVAPVLPVVYVSRISDNQPAGGAQVKFTMTGPDNSTTTSVVQAGSDGFARLTSWRIGQVIGKYTATATVDGSTTPVVFAIHLRGSIVAIYDQSALDGVPVAIKPDGAHIVLFQDGTYNQFSGDIASYTYPSGIGGTYLISRSEVDFIDEPSSGNAFEKPFGYVHARGALTGSVMNVTYVGYSIGLADEFPAPPPESYVLRAN